MYNHVDQGRKHKINAELYDTFILGRTRKVFREQASIQSNVARMPQMNMNTQIPDIV